MVQKKSGVQQQKNTRRAKRAGDESWKMRRATLPGRLCDVNGDVVLQIQLTHTLSKSNAPRHGDWLASPGMAAVACLCRRGVKKKGKDTLAICLVWTIAGMGLGGEKEEK